MGEIAVIVLLGLLVFGPDKLPNAVKSIVAGVRTIRASAADATRSLQDAAGWDGEQTRQAIDDIAQMHPKRLIGSILDDPGDAADPAASSKRNSSAAGAQGGGLGDFDPDAP